MGWVSPFLRPVSLREEVASAPVSTLLGTGGRGQARMVVLLKPGFQQELSPPAHLRVWAFQSAAAMERTLKMGGGKVLFSSTEQETTFLKSITELFPCL